MGNISRLSCDENVEVAGPDPLELTTKTDADVSETQRAGEFAHEPSGNEKHRGVEYKADEEVECDAAKVEYKAEYETAKNEGAPESRARGDTENRYSDSEDDFCESAAVYSERLEATIPDGGFRAWLVVLGSFCGLVISFGLTNATGTIQDYLSRNQLQSYSDSSIGWVFSVWMFCMFLGSVQTGPLFDAYGLWPLIIPGCLLWVASLCILSVCEKYYEFFLGFSVLGGLSASMIFNPAVTVIGHWFTRRRAFATGIATTGGSVGGIFMPLMLNRLFPRIGYGWTIRVLALIILVLGLVCCLTMKSRHMRRKVDWKEIIPDFRSLRDPDFFFCCFGVFLVELAVFVPLVYIVTYARAQGLSGAYSNALLAYLNVGSCIGRITPGYVADRFGNYNVAIITSTVTGILCIALWIPAGTTKAGVTTFAVLFGFWSGSTISLTPVCVSAISTTANYGKRYGTAYSIASIAALIGLPIAGALTGDNYLGLQIFSGAAYLAGASMFGVARWIAVRNKAIF